MTSFKDKKIMMMAGGTGGHVYPALAVAKVLKDADGQVEWLGNSHGFEGKKVPEYGFKLNDIQVRGLRGNGILGWCKAPFMIAKSVLQARRILKKFSPDLVIGMGGFASGPGAIAAKSLGINILIHEQNAIMGMTNRWVAKFANIVLLADKRAASAVSNKKKIRVIGNPVRQEIIDIEEPISRYKNRVGNVRLLVLGGSQGAKKINEIIPEALSLIEKGERPIVTHQAGSRWYEAVKKAYYDKNIEANVIDFADDIASLYATHDIVIARSGALTVAEIAAVGLPALLIPFPYAVDDHQTMNAQALADIGAADLIQESELTVRKLAEYIINNRDRAKLETKAELATQVAFPNALNNIIKEIKGLCL